MALAALATLKTMLAVTGTSEDDRLSAFLVAADACVKTHCMRDLESASYVEYHSGNGMSRLALRQRPVTAVSEVLLDDGGYFGEASGGFGSTTALVEGEDFSLDWDRNQAVCSSGILWRIGGSWPMRLQWPQPRMLSSGTGPAIGNIKVSYTAGFTTVPKDLEYACCLLAARMRRDTKYGGWGLMSEHLGDYSYRLGQVDARDPEIGTIRSILSRYRESGW